MKHSLLTTQRVVVYRDCNGTTREARDSLPRARALKVWSPASRPRLDSRRGRPLAPLPDVYLPPLVAAAPLIRAAVAEDGLALRVAAAAQNAVHEDAQAESADAAGVFSSGRRGAREADRRFAALRLKRRRRRRRRFDRRRRRRFDRRRRRRFDRRRRRRRVRWRNQHAVVSPRPDVGERAETNARRRMIQ